jgi:hypothetical protein
MLLACVFFCALNPVFPGGRSNTLSCHPENGTGNGSSWANAPGRGRFSGLGWLLRGSGDEFWIAAGKITGPTDTDRIVIVQPKSGVYLYGEICRRRDGITSVGTGPRTSRYSPADLDL